MYTRCILAVTSPVPCTQPARDADFPLPYLAALGFLWRFFAIHLCQARRQAVSYVPTTTPTCRCSGLQDKFFFWGIAPKRLSWALCEEGTPSAEGRGHFHSRWLGCCKGLCQELGRNFSDILNTWVIKRKLQGEELKHFCWCIIFSKRYFCPPLPYLCPNPLLPRNTKMPGHRLGPRRMVQVDEQQ